MAKTVLKARPADRPPIEEPGFLERALVRALANLEADPTLTGAERAAAKTALASAMASALRDALAGTSAEPEPAPEMFSFAPAPTPGSTPVQAQTRARPGYFRKPSEPIGLSEGVVGAEDGAEVRLTGGKATWLRVAPRGDSGEETGKTWTCAALRTAMLKAGKVVRPIFAASQGMGHVRAADGFGTYSTSPSVTESAGVAFCFRTGEIWAVDTYIQDALREQQPMGAILSLQAQLTMTFASYVGLLDRLGAPKPYRWIIGMDGLLGRSLTLPEGEMAGFPRGYCVRDTVEVAGTYDGSQSLEQALQPFFDALYEACGIPVS